jgi:hypothetical protein
VQKRISERKRRQITGRRAQPTFVMLPHYVLRSPQFVHLDPYAKALFMYWAGKYEGANNGDFSAPNNRYKEIGFKSSLTLHRAKQELVRSCWAVITRHGHKRACSLFGLTIWAIDECEGKLEVPSERVASHLWKTQSVVHDVNISGSPRELKLLKRAA